MNEGSVSYGVLALYKNDRVIVFKRILASTVLGGSGDLVSRLIMGISGVSIWAICLINLLTKSP